MKRSMSIPNKVYKFIHRDDVYIQTNLSGRASSFEWLEISADGRITVKCSHGNGYAWDGCTPKRNFIDLTWGTPDGRLDYATEKPITYYASMIHDALYQYKADLPLSRKEVDLIFLYNLQRPAFKLAYIYYFFVRLFGGFLGKWKVTSSAEKIRISEFSWLH